MADSTEDLDKFALASMIADHLRGIAINPAELPPGAHRLVAAYVARHDYGRVRAQGTFGGLTLRFTSRDHTGAPLPDVPTIDRGAARVIDCDSDDSPTDPPARVLSASGGQLRPPVAEERNRDG